MTLARYPAAQSPAPMPPMVRAGDDVLHLIKVVIAAEYEARYIVDDDNRYLGAITNRRQAREV
jgi:hypothetical protein